MRSLSLFSHGQRIPYRRHQPGLCRACTSLLIPLLLNFVQASLAQRPKKFMQILLSCMRIGRVDCKPFLMMVSYANIRMCDGLLTGHFAESLQCHTCDEHFLDKRDLACHETSCDKFLLRNPNGIPSACFTSLPALRKLDDNQMLSGDVNDCEYLHAVSAGDLHGKSSRHVCCTYQYALSFTARCLTCHTLWLIVLSMREKDADVTENTKYVFNGSKTLVLHSTS